MSSRYGNCCNIDLYPQLKSCQPGKQGEKGEKGDQGIQGIPGPSAGSFLVQRTNFVDTANGIVAGIPESPSISFSSIQDATDQASPAIGTIWVVQLRSFQNYGSVIARDNVYYQGQGKSSVIGSATVGTDLLLGGTIVFENLTISSGSPVLFLDKDTNVTFKNVWIEDINTDATIQIIAGTFTSIDCTYNIFQPETAIHRIIEVSTDAASVTLTNNQINIITPELVGSLNELDLVHLTNSSAEVTLDMNTWTVNSNCEINFVATEALFIGSTKVTGDRLEIISTITRFNLVNHLSTVSLLSIADVTVRTDPVNPNVGPGNSLGTVSLLNIDWVNFDGLPQFISFIPATTIYTATDEHGSLWYAGGESTNYKEVSGSLVTGPHDRDLIFSNSDATPFINSNPVIMTLPKASEREGRLVLSKLLPKNNYLKVIPDLSDTINGNIDETYSIYDSRDSVLLQSDGVNTWQTINLTQPLKLPDMPELFIYLNRLGYDLNDGISPLTPVATIDRALSIVQEIGWNRLVTLDFQPDDQDTVTTYRLSFDHIYNLRDTARGSNNQAIIFRGPTKVVQNLGKITVFAQYAEGLPSGQLLVKVSVLPVGSVQGLLAVFTGPAVIPPVTITNNVGLNLYILSTDASIDYTLYTVAIHLNLINLEVRNTRFKNGTLVLRNIDFVMLDSVLPDFLPLSLGFIDLNIFHDNVRFIGNGDNANMLRVGCKVLAGKYSSIYSDDYVSQQAGDIYINCNVVNSNVYYSVIGTYFEKATVQNLDCTGNWNTVYATECILSVSTSDLDMDSIIMKNNRPSTTFSIDKSTVSISNAMFDNLDNVFTVNGSKFYIFQFAITNCTSPMKISESNVNIDKANIVCTNATSRIEIIQSNARIATMLYTSPYGILFDQSNVHIDNLTLIDQIIDHSLIIKYSRIDSSSLNIYNNAIPPNANDTILIIGSIWNGSNTTLNRKTGNTINDSKVSLVNLTLLNHVDTPAATKVSNSDVRISGLSQVNNRWLWSSVVNSNLEIIYSQIEGEFSLGSPYITADRSTISSIGQINPIGSWNTTFISSNMSTVIWRNWIATYSLNIALSNNPIIYATNTRLEISDVTINATSKGNNFKVISVNGGQVNLNTVTISLSALLFPTLQNVAWIRDAITVVKNVKFRGGNNCCHFIDSIASVNDSVFTNTTESVLKIENTRLSLNTVECSGAVNPNPALAHGITMERSSTGYFEKVTSGLITPNSGYGINLISGSSFSNLANTNTIKGTLGNVRLGNSSNNPVAWADVNTGLRKFTTDYGNNTNDIPQYVLISPGNEV